MTKISHFTVATSCILVLFLCPYKNLADQGDGSSQGICHAGKDSMPCPTSNVKEETIMKEVLHEQQKQQEDPENLKESDSLLQRSMQGLEGVIDKMATSKDEMVNNLIDKMSESRTKVMEGLDSMMDKMSESGTKVKEGFDSMMEKVSISKEKMMEGLDNVIDQVSHSKMMEEIDHVIESVSHSQVLKEIRALPQEIRESFILSARNRSYIAAGVLVAIAAAILFGGAIYYAWCHHDAWSYYIGTIDEAKALLRQAKESRFGRRSRTSSEDNNESETTPLISPDNLPQDKDIKNGDLSKEQNSQTLLSSDLNVTPSKKTGEEEEEGEIQELKSEMSEGEEKKSMSNDNDVFDVSDEQINHCDEKKCENVILEGKRDE